MRTNFTVVVLLIATCCFLSNGQGSQSDEKKSLLYRIEQLEKQNNMLISDATSMSSKIDKLTQTTDELLDYKTKSHERIHTVEMRTEFISQIPKKSGGGIKVSGAINIYTDNNIMALEATNGLKGPDEKPKWGVIYMLGNEHKHVEVIGHTLKW